MNFVAEGLSFHIVGATFQSPETVYINTGDIRSPLQFIIHHLQFIDLTYNKLPSWGDYINTLEANF
jgi:hypothetical protein